MNDSETQYVLISLLLSEKIKNDLLVIAKSKNTTLTNVIISSLQDGIKNGLYSGGPNT